MTSIEFTTPKGATVRLVADRISGIDAEVNGKLHTHGAARFVGGAAAHVKLAGKIQAQVQPADVDRILGFFAQVERDQAAARAAYKPTDDDRDGQLAERFYSPRSDL